MKALKQFSLHVHIGRLTAFIISQVDTAPAGSVIMISCPPTMVNACWGGLTTRRSQIRNVAGTIISGRCRDLDEIRGIKFPVNK